MRQPLIAGNWKMNGSTQFTTDMLATLKESCVGVSGVQFAVFPPFVYLDQCRQLLSDSVIQWGAQTVSEKPEGALTGDISVGMLTDLDCHYAILGHSERRHILGETNEQIAEKVAAASRGGLIPILCVGETLAERESDKTLTIIKEQLAHVLRLKDNLPALASMVVAYEPVWAIGTGKSASPEQAQEVHAAIRDYCDQAVSGLGASLQILYGGSVKSNNTAALSAMPDVDGALIGGASLQADQFIEIGKRWNR